MKSKKKVNAILELFEYLDITNETILDTINNWDKLNLNDLSFSCQSNNGEMYKVFIKNVVNNNIPGMLVTITSNTSKKGDRVIELFINRRGVRKIDIKSSLINEKTKIYIEKSNRLLSEKIDRLYATRTFIDPIKGKLERTLNFYAKENERALFYAKVSGNDIIIPYWISALNIGYFLTQRSILKNNNCKEVDRVRLSPYRLMRNCLLCAESNITISATEAGVNRSFPGIMRYVNRVFPRYKKLTKGEYKLIGPLDELLSEAYKDKKDNQDDNQMQLKKNRVSIYGTKNN